MATFQARGVDMLSPVGERSTRYRHLRYPEYATRMSQLGVVGVPYRQRYRTVYAHAAVRCWSTRHGVVASIRQRSLLPTARHRARAVISAPGERASPAHARRCASSRHARYSRAQGGVEKVGCRSRQVVAVEAKKVSRRDVAQRRCAAKAASERRGGRL